MYHTFLRFFQPRLEEEDSSPNNATLNALGEPTGQEGSTEKVADTHDLDVLAIRFSELIPEGTYSLAQIQEFLIRKHNDPREAVEGVLSWMEEQNEEKRKIEEKRKLAEERRQLKQSTEAETAATVPVDSTNEVLTTGGQDQQNASNPITEVPIVPPVAANAVEHQEKDS